MDEAHDMVEELAAAMVALKRAMDTADHLVSERLGLNRTDARCLSLLVSRGDMSTSELAALSLVRPAAMTFVIDRLERAGHVRRERSPEDRRRVILRVDPETVASLTGLWKERADEVERHLAAYPPEQQRVLLEFLVTQTELQSRHNERLTAPGEAARKPRRRPGGSSE
jgi:DNA-binding MarR family transcriptional regulator